MDCIHYKVLEEGRIVSRAAYVVLGVTADGYKEILSITIVKDILFFCVDGLPGFKEAIRAVFPKVEV